MMALVLGLVTSPCAVRLISIGEEGGERNALSASLR